MRTGTDARGSRSGAEPSGDQRLLAAEGGFAAVASAGMSSSMDPDAGTGADAAQSPLASAGDGGELDAQVTGAEPGELNGSFQEELPASLLGKVALAMRHANLSPGACRGELRKRGVKTGNAGLVTPGIATPMRIASPLRGVAFVAPGKRSIYGVLDCRLLLVLDDLSDVLARHDVSTVLIDNFYRRRARLPGRKSRSQHAYGLAADVYGFTLRDGRQLIIERDWRGQLGTPACGPESRILDGNSESLALRNLVCDIARAGLFHHILTPNFNEAHENHLHMDIKRGDREGRIH
ncbi:MAG TPA: extensin family protein [Polyangiaceae bacterium]|nr:extensin family protein [Polyangiaceae bacterium]